MEVARDEAEDVAAQAFRAHSISESDAALTAEVLVSADARGKRSHGLLRLPRFIRGIKHNNVDPDGAIELQSESGATAVLNGGSRLGPVVAAEAVGEAITRADNFGIGLIGVQNSNHLGMLGYYTDWIRTQGYIGLGMTNTEPAMPPYGGAESILGTNPLAISLPTDPPFNLDMSTSAISRGEVLHRKEADIELPDGVALNAEGEPTNDPAEALEGVILPFGGMKGSGLAIAIEVLAGGLVGAAMGNNVQGTYQTENRCTKGDVFVVIDPDSLVGDFEQRASTFLRELKAIDHAANTPEIYLPGERSIDADRAVERIEIEEDLWNSIRALTSRE